MRKNIILLASAAASLLFLESCSVNPATGRQQFTGLMSPAQENQVGSSEHEKILQEFGAYTENGVDRYVSEVGARVTANTERPDVTYKFTVLDSDIVNAFALPGGYIYVSRGLLALANSEAELAAVLAHEAGHITGKHSAERYSRGVVTSLGASILSAAIDKTGVSQALGIGSDLYMKSYSRDQENEADTLGIRYLTRAGYDPSAMTSFLANLQNSSALEDRIAGNGPSSPIEGYFSTHPATQDRVNKTAGEAQAAGAGNGTIGRDAYLQRINGIVYGESARHGFIRGQDFIHPVSGFAFSVPKGFKLINQPSQVVAQGPGGAVIVFDMDANSQGLDAGTYLSQVWMKGEGVKSLENVTVNGMRGATAAFSGQVNGQPSSIRLMAIEYKPNMFARFQIAIPNNASGSLVEDLKRTTYSFRKLSEGEKASAKPYRLRLYKAQAGEKASAIAARQPFDEYAEDRFRVLNALPFGRDVQAGQSYKIVTK
ncbi:MAG: M48 family metalloprotease [Alphaproteobacteria bacterium]|nr:M48 family metalloprotease [Alphaproteobacteria bacterium]MCD8571363.1 M48 family metalloprotease [Alphaproteobacteria bacterium]